jgi:hypothetical protein
MSVPITIQTIQTRPVGFTIRLWRSTLKESMTELGLYWWRTYAPMHFKQDAAGRYGYKPRSEKYLRSGWKRGKPPLFLTGETFKRVVQTTPMIRAYPTRATLDFRTPRYVNMRPMAPNKPNLGKEITTVTPGERIDLALYVRDVIRKKVFESDSYPFYTTWRPA